MPPMQRCFSDLVCQLLVKSYVIDTLFGHVAPLDPGIRAQDDAVRLMVDTYEGRKPMASWRRPLGFPRNVWLNKFRRMPTIYFYLRCGDLRSPWVTERRNGSLGIRDDDHDDDDDEECKTYVKNGGKTNFSRHLQAIRNRDCGLFENH